MLPHLRIHRWIWAGETPPCSTLAFTGLLESLISCRASFFVLRRFRDTNFIGLGFVIAEPSLEVPP